MKKVLFVTYDFPYPTNTGGKNRAYHMLKYSGPGFKKFLFSFVRSDFKESDIKALEEIGVEVVKTEHRRKVLDFRNLLNLTSNNSIFKTLYYSDKVLSSIVSIVKKYEIDIVHYESFYTGFFISDEIKSLGARQIYGSENIEYKIYEDYVKNSSVFLRPLYNYQVKKIKKEEEEMLAKADLCLAVSDTEAEVIRKKAAECEVIRNGVDIDTFKYKKPGEKAQNLLFVGNFSYFPNVDAITFFYNEVFEGFSENVKLTVIGKKVSDLKIRFGEDVERIDFIPDILDAYHNADIMVAPIRMGGGTNFKILEAMAAGVPVVSLDTRLEGLDIEDKKNIIIAKDAAEFKENLKKLISDQDLRIKISKNARDLVEKEYSWRIIGNNLATVWKNL